MELGDRPLRAVAVELGRASQAARREQAVELDAARLAGLVDVELGKLLRARREARRVEPEGVAGSRSAHSFIESGETSDHGAALAVELAALAAALRLLGRVVAAEAA